MMMMKGFGLDESISNLTSTVSGEASISSNARNESSSTTTNTNTNTNTMLYPQASSSSSFISPNQAHPSPSQPPPCKKKRNLPGNPDPDAEVISLSPKSLLATNRFVCEICNKGFQRDQNLQLHRRGHNLPWKLKQRDKDQIIRRKVYVCPEPSCVHHDPSRALGDLTGIKKHFCRKHGEKKWKCEKCSKKYAVQSDWKAHSKICGTREYRCDCGTLFSRRDSFITHRAFCDALAEESARAINPTTLPSLPQGAGGSPTTTLPLPPHLPSHPHSLPLKREHHEQNLDFCARTEVPPWLACPPPQQAVLENNQHRHLQSMGSGPPPVPPTSVVQMDHGGHLFSFQQYGHQDQHHHLHGPSPNSLDHAGPTLSSFQIPSPPQMSATALLQKAAQIGVTSSNNQHQYHQQTTRGVVVNNKPQPHTQMSAGVTSSREEGHHHLINNNTGFIQGGAQSSSMLHDMMIMNSLQATNGLGFDDFHHNHQSMPSSKPPPLDGGKTGGDGLTRDFLGLRTFSHKDFLNMAALGHMSTSSSSFQQQHEDHQGQTPW